MWRGAGEFRAQSPMGGGSVEHEIVFLDRESVGADVREPNFPHNYTEYQSTWTPEDIVDRLKDATIALINKCRCARTSSSS